MKATCLLFPESEITERHDAQCTAMADGFADQGAALIMAVSMRRKLLAHFDEHEKPVADAIRRGLKPIGREKRGEMGLGRAEPEERVLYVMGEQDVI